MKKILLLVLYLSACVDKFSGQDVEFDDSTCKEEVERVERQYMCLDRFGCQNYNNAIINKTIICSNILLNSLILPNYKQSHENYPFRYPVTLKVVDSEISVLPPNTFKNFNQTNITILVLENIKLKTIMPAAFGFLHVREIYLRGNELTDVSDGIFNTMPQLEILDLSNNKIQTLSDHAFVGTNLKELNLHNNHVSGVGEIDFNLKTRLKKHNFDGSPQRNLDLSQNCIEIIDFGVLKKVSGIVNISFNNISNITNFGLSQASELKLSHNLITNFEKNHYVEVLDLSYNGIKVLGNDLFNPNLLKFFASFNSIALLKSKTFFNLSKLTHLYLDNNNISSIPNSCFKDLISLTHLNLSGNKLTYFNFGTFDSLIHLQILDISVNNLKELPQFSIHSLTELTSLYFQDNEINDIDINALVGHLQELIIINLNNNVWSCHKLANIVHTLKKYRVSIIDGNSWEESNIHGIQCYEIFANPNSKNNSKLELNLNDSKMNSFFNEEFTKSQMYKYFNQDFRRSDMYNYFNKDFRGSNFFKYLENLRDRALNASKSEKLNENKLEDIASSFKSIAMELENISKDTELHYHNYVNKILPINGTDKVDDINNLRTEKLIGSHESTFDYPNYTGLLSIIATLLLILVCIKGVVAYRQLFHVNKFTFAKKEEVELI